MSFDAPVSRARSFEHPVLIGQSRYAPTRTQFYGGDVETELRLREYRPFGIDAGVGCRRGCWATSSWH